jgi:hypothetical protein
VNFRIEANKGIALKEKSKPQPLHPFSFIPSATILQQNYVQFAVSLQTPCSHLLLSVNQILTLIKLEIAKKKIQQFHWP